MFIAVKAILSYASWACLILTSKKRKKQNKTTQSWKNRYGMWCPGKVNPSIVLTNSWAFHHLTFWFAIYAQCVHCCLASVCMDSILSLQNVGPNIHNRRPGLVDNMVLEKSLWKMLLWNEYLIPLPGRYFPPLLSSTGLKNLFFCSTWNLQLLAMS